tara:strand:+ start:101 stop:397 length:297 start_codon:yes stop_codon:yes gene_type:complete
MLVKLIEVSKNNSVGVDQNYIMSEIFVNPENIVNIREDAQISTLFREGKLPWDDLSQNTVFSTITMNAGGFSSTLTVAGSPAQIQEKCFSARKQLLKG